MIGFLEGKLRFKSPEQIVVDVHGVGYIVTVPLSTFYDLPGPGEAVALHIHTHVREDAIQLFGFRTAAEKEMFLHLVTVNGVGPKMAANILSGITPDELRLVVRNQDHKRLQNLPGIGKKIAERLLLELRDKLKIKADKTEAPTTASSASGVFADAFSALVNLGYRPAEAEKVLTLAGKQFAEEPPLEQLLKEALRRLA